MPRFFDPSQLHSAIEARALPTLEQMANHPSLRDNSLNHRFERDDPPPYVSSSESEEEEALHHPVLARSRGPVLEEFKDLVCKPLSDGEIEDLLRSLSVTAGRVGTGLGTEPLVSKGSYNPGYRYSVEASKEHDRLDLFYRRVYRHPHADDDKLDLWSQGQGGYPRRNIIVRRNIRKRWQRLGIWNPEWGIPGRVNKQPNDATEHWRWKWQSADDPPPMDPRHPASRAVQLRRNLAYGEYAPPSPRSHLREGSSASEAESFVISRPWFVLKMEKLEFASRTQRIPVERSHYLTTSEMNQVNKWWEERGDWPPGWKWRHESPSPEPEGLTPLDTDDMDFTPSMVDALKAIPPPPPKPRSPTPIYEPHDPARPIFRFGTQMNAPEDPGFDAAEEAGYQLGQEIEEEQAPNPPRRRRGRPRKQSQPAEAAAVSPPPPPRRSASIAARNANPPEPRPPVSASETRTRKPRGHPAAPPERNAPVPARMPKKRGPHGRHKMVVL